MQHPTLSAIEHQAMLAELSISRCARSLPDTHCPWMQEARSAIYRIQDLCKQIHSGTSAPVTDPTPPPPSPETRP